MARRNKFKTSYDSEPSYSINQIKNGRDNLAFYFGSAHRDYKIDTRRVAENKDLIKKIGIWSGMSYSDLRAAPKDKIGSEFIPTNQLKKPLPQTYFSKDVEKVDVMRFSGSSCRIIGVYSKSDGVFDVAFVDYGLDIYNH